MLKHSTLVRVLKATGFQVAVAQEEKAQGVQALLGDQVEQADMVDQGDQVAWVVENR